MGFYHLIDDIFPLELNDDLPISPLKEFVSPTFDSYLIYYDSEDADPKLGECEK